MTDMGKLNVGRNRSAREALDLMLVREALEALKTVIERFPGNGRVTCRACDVTFREDDGTGHPPSCPVKAAIMKLEERLLET